ncbi:hypothetical protein B0H13DRAFT_1672392 [Mycena leptocephala]|nr:hypothetical protein B0H13DRAFT_1672392 [Mycena leptocephala]
MVAEEVVDTERRSFCRHLPPRNIESTENKNTDKDFAFYKQHACAHVNDDIRNKGVPAGYSTRPDEGFHQEVKEAYSQTNFKNTDPQVKLCSIHTRILMLDHNLVQFARVDENKEAFAHIRMAIEEYDAAVNSMDGEEYEDLSGRSPNCTGHSAHC